MLTFVGQAATWVVAIAIALALAYAAYHFLRDLFTGGWVRAFIGLCVAAIAIYALSQVFVLPGLAKTGVDEIKKQTNHVNTTVGG